MGVRDGERGRLAAGLVILVAVLVAGACSPDNARPNLVPASTTTSTSEVPVPRAIGRSPSSTLARTLTAPDPNAFQTIVATATVDELSVLDEPDGDVIDLFGNPTPSGGPLVLVVEAAGDDWHEVRLPVAPVDRRGWISADDVELAAHEYRIEVDTIDLVLRVYQRTAVVVEAQIGIDPDDVPPPGPSTYVTELLQSAEPNPVYGTYAYGLSGFSDEFATFTGEAGQFGIHGTTDGDSIGVTAPAGSIRLADADIEALVSFLPLGVIVDVV